MKKWISLLTALALPLSFCACGVAEGSSTATASAPPALLQAGYGKVDITPTEPVPLTADGNVLHSGVLDLLYATCLYFVDENGTELYLVALDQCNMYPPLPEIRAELAVKLGISDQQIMFSASHTHSAVKLRATNELSTLRYISALRQSLEELVLSAKADAKPVTGIYHAATETEGLNFVRRYIMNDGSFAGDNYGSAASGYAAHESEGDRTLQLLKLTREGGKDIILTNFQTHPHRAAYDVKGNANISSDIVGVYRAELEQLLDCHAMYYTGASGNVNPTSKITEENIHKDHREHGKAMAAFAVEAAKDFQPLEFGTIQLKKTLYVGDCYHSEDYKLPEAKIVAERFNSGMGKTASLEGYEELFEHPRHAIAIVSRVSQPETLEVPLYSFSIGDFAACYAPFELFAELGVQLKAASPFAATFVCCLSNDIYSYMPTKEAFANGGYGPYKCNFEPGTGEKLVEAFTNQLTTLHESQGE